MKIFLLLLLVFHISAYAAGRDCLKEAHDFKLAHNVSTMWSSQLDVGEKTISQICKEGDDHIENMIDLYKIIRRKTRVEYARKHTYTMSPDSDAHFQDLEGEISNEELCKTLDKHIKDAGDCTSPSDYLRGLVFDDYKNFGKICLKNLPEQQKRMISCRKK